MCNIIFLAPIYKDYIWGGENLKKKLKKNTPYSKTAESWEICANTNDSCKVLNEEYKNKSLIDLFNDKKNKVDIFGTKCEKMKEFPLLIKFIDAKENLSIQVHPDDIYAKSIGLNNGKNEMWYIIECEENSQIIGGFNKKIDKEQLEAIIANNNIMEHLNYISVEKGDGIYIEAGTVHAILKHTLICEIQQNCDITYRVFDWDRVDKNGNARQLHKNEALQTIKPDLKPIIKHSDNNKMVQNLIKNKYFVTDKINCNNNFKDYSNQETFYAINVVNGNGIIKYKNKEIEIKSGDSFIIPAKLGSYEISGKIEILKSYIY